MLLSKTNIQIINMVTLNLLQYFLSDVISKKKKIVILINWVPKTISNFIRKIILKIDVACNCCYNNFIGDKLIYKIYIVQ